MQTKIIETPRLLLRPVVESDAEAMYDYCKNPNVGPEAGWKPHRDLQETREIMNAIFLNKDNIFAMEYKPTGQLIGTIGLMPDPHRQNPNVLMLGYALAEPFWGQGLTAEAASMLLSYAFRELPISMISCTCYTTNRRSRRVIEKCGFGFDGCLLQGELRYDGAVMDVLCFSLSKERFYAQSAE